MEFMYYLGAKVKNIKIENGYFYQFDNFNNCSFPENSIVFYDCRFVYTNIDNNKEIRKSHFDKCKFRFSNIADIAMGSEKLKQVKKENAEEFLANLAKYIRMGQRSEHLIKRNVSPKPKNLSKTLKLLTDNKYEFLIRKKLKNEFVYRIINSADADRLKMKDFGGYDKLLEALSEEM